MPSQPKNRVRFFNCALCIVHCAFWFFCSCANQVAPTGGEKDITPPKALKFSPENYSTNFQSKEIEITFDEYIQLKDINAQLVVSPPLKYPVTTKVKGKQLLVSITDTLRADATYTFNFGSAIIDLHEGNALEGFQYVFSTGNEIDSMTVEGKLENAFDKKTEKGIYVMLYRGTDDSLPMTSLPDYFGRTDESGMFRIRNVSPLSYKIFALKDLNSNYLFDSKDESVAFSDTLVKAGENNVELKMFKEEATQQLLKAWSDEPGKATVAYSRPLLSPEITFLSDTAVLKIYSVTYSPKKDSITFWYRNQSADSLSCIIRHEEKIDSVTIRLRVVEGRKSSYVPKLFIQYQNRGEFSQDLNKPMQFLFNHPVESFDLSKASVMRDSMEVKNLSIAFSDSLHTNLVLRPAEKTWKENTTYTVLIPSGTFTDIFGLQNDSIVLNFKTKSITDYGTLALQLNLPSKNSQYLLQLVDEKENVFRESIVTTDTLLYYDFLDPRVYRIKLLEDKNKNQKWDTGNYLLHQQPEPVSYYIEPITVRANWDVEIKW